MSAYTHVTLRTRRAAILTAATDDARLTAARAYQDAFEKTPAPGRLLAGMLDAFGGRYSAGEYREMAEAVEQAKEACR